MLNVLRRTVGKANGITTGEDALINLGRILSLGGPAGDATDRSQLVCVESTVADL